MFSKITLALAFALAIAYAVPASADPEYRPYQPQHYDSSGAPVAPYSR